MAANINGSTVFSHGMHKLSYLELLKKSSIFLEICMVTSSILRYEWGKLIMQNLQILTSLYGPVPVNCNWPVLYHIQKPTKMNEKQRIKLLFFCFILTYHTTAQKYVCGLLLHSFHLIIKILLLPFQLPIQAWMVSSGLYSSTFGVNS